MRFHNISYRFPKVEIDWEFLNGRFKYLLYISKNPQFLESFEPLPTYLGVRAAKPEMEKVSVIGDPPSTLHQTTLAP